MTDVGHEEPFQARTLSARLGSTAAQQTSPLDSVRSEPTFQFRSSYRLPGFSPAAVPSLSVYATKKGRSLVRAQWEEAREKFDRTDNATVQWRIGELRELIKTTPPETLPPWQKLCHLA
jgi:hypothetical protein